MLRERPFCTRGWWRQHWLGRRISLSSFKGSCAWWGGRIWRCCFMLLNKYPATDCYETMNCLSVPFPLPLAPSCAFPSCTCSGSYSFLSVVSVQVAMLAQQATTQLFVLCPDMNKTTGSCNTASHNFDLCKTLLNWQYGKSIRFHYFLLR